MIETIKSWFTAISCLGLISGVRYMLGIAQEGVDFIDCGQ